MKKMEKEKFGGVVGDKGFEYYYIGVLATAPKHQGHGYGSALVENILFSVRAFNKQSFPGLFAIGRLEGSADLPVCE